MSHLIDTNVLVAAGWNAHVNYAVANAWLGRQARFATCSSVQCGFLRVSLSPAIGADFAQAQVALDQIISLPGHTLVVDDIPASGLPMVTGLHQALGGRRGRVHRVTGAFRVKIERFWLVFVKIGLPHRKLGL